MRLADVTTGVVKCTYMTSVVERIGREPRTVFRLADRTYSVLAVAEWYVVSEVGLECVCWCPVVWSPCKVCDEVEWDVRSKVCVLAVLFEVVVDFTVVVSVWVCVCCVLIGGVLRCGSVYILWWYVGW